MAAGLKDIVMISLFCRNLVVDSNYLRNPELERLLRRSRRTQIILCDDVVMEMLKGDPFRSVPNSLDILKLFPKRVKVLRRSYELRSVQKRRLRHSDLIDPESAEIIPKIFQLITQGISQTDWTFDFVKGMARYSRNNFSRRFGDVQGWTSAFTQCTSEASPSQLEEIRNGGDLSEDTVKMISWNAAYVARTIGESDAIDYNMLTPSQVVNAYSFRLSVCFVITALHWKATGSPKKNSRKMMNDLVDASIAAAATMFDGILTSDKKLIRIYKSAKATLDDSRDYINKFIMDAYGIRYMRALKSESGRGFSYQKVLRALLLREDNSDPFEDRLK
jgi:hypothetical protein